MRSISLWLPLALAGLLAAQQNTTPTPDRDPLVVHEWGTFTSMQGSDGITLEGLHWEEEALPRFVHSLVRFDEQAAAEQGMREKAGEFKRKGSELYVKS